MRLFCVGGVRVGAAPFTTTTLPWADPCPPSLPPSAPPRSAITECYAKCIPMPRDGDLNIGEMACLDRCVPKYLETHAAVGRELEGARATRAAQVAAVSGDAATPQK